MLHLWKITIKRKGETVRIKEERTGIRERVCKVWRRRIVKTELQQTRWTNNNPET